MTEDLIDPFCTVIGHFICLDVVRIQAALPDLLGEHDFASLQLQGIKQLNRVTITRADIEVKSDDKNSFTFEAHAFLYNQIRIMVGVLLEIGNGRRDVHDIVRLIAVKIVNSRFIALASGLY